jgi:ribonuclease BN (tRNA processing enzyme)
MILDQKGGFDIGTTLETTRDGTGTGGDGAQRFDLVCFSHLRWDFVFQRPQHLLTRFARRGRVFYVEEPVREKGCEPHFAISVPGMRPGKACTR